MKCFTIAATAFLSASQVIADPVPEALEGYVEANILGIFYHEMGHALIDMQDLPIFGQEEDAADVLSVFLIDAFYEEDAAVSLAYDTAFGFLGEADAYEGEEQTYWGVHGPDLQRYYNLVCLFYGANPDERDDVAEELGLPEERAETCEEEYEQASYSWGNALDELAQDGGGDSFVITNYEPESEAGKFMASVLEPEVEAWNEDFQVPDTLEIRIESCGEANAFYDPSEQDIIMCTEFVDHLVEYAPE